jgi:hypothetical protein
VSDEVEGYSQLDSVEALTAELRRRVLANPPSCLRDVVKRPAKAQPLGNELLTVAFELSGQRGQEVARVLAYDLHRFSPEYQGPTYWISPVMLHWEGEESPVVVFDAKKHGYHGECGSAAKVRGAGTPDVLRCLTCGADRFRITTDFAYWGATFDLLEDAYNRSDWEDPVHDYFGAVNFRHKCVACGGTGELMQGDL